MKLFLTSETITPPLAESFLRLVGKPAREIKLALIENAADVETDPEEWLQENRFAMSDIGLRVSQIDLRDYFDGSGDLEEDLEKYDVIWLGGGNTYYLRWILRETGADEIIHDLVAKGKVFGGGSAGAIITGPSIEFVDEADDPAKSPEVINDGLSLADTVIVPHWSDEKYGSIIARMEAAFINAGYDTLHITNDQAAVFDAGKFTIIG